MQFLSLLLIKCRKARILREKGLNNVIRAKFFLLTVNDFHIASIEALDVPAGAVNISKDNQTNDWILSFSSHYYDNVTFKVTDTNGGTSYFFVKRYTVDAWIKL